MTVIEILKKSIKKRIKETNKYYKKSDRMIPASFAHIGLLAAYRDVLKTLIPEVIETAKNIEKEDK